MAVSKKSPAKKAAAKKSAARASGAKKKPATTKTVPKKAVPKKTVAKKTVANKAAGAASKTTATKKKAASKNVTAKKTAVKKTAPAKKASSQKATATKKVKYPFTPAFLRQQEAALLDERTRYMRHAESLKAEADQLARDREPGDVQFDEESGEGDGIAVERERDLALSAQARDAVDEIDRALERLKAGTYGISIVSGLPIPKERLEAIPHADMRVDEKTRGMTWR